MDGALRLRPMRGTRHDPAWRRPTGPRRHAIAALAAAVVLLAAPEGAVAQQSAMPAIADSPTALALLEEARAQAADNPVEAARLARRLLDEYGDRVVPVDVDDDGEGLFASAADEAERFLLAHPAVLARFRDAEGRAAERLLEADGPDATVRRRRFTRAGLDATMVLAERALLEDRPGRALALLARIARHPDLSSGAVAHAALAGQASARLGDAAASASAVAALEALGTDDARLAAAQVARTAPSTGAAGGPARSPLDHGAPVAAPDAGWREIWSAPLEQPLFRRLFETSGPTVADSIVSRARDNASWMTTVPVLRDGLVLVHEGTLIRAFDADARTERWSRQLSSGGVERDAGGVLDLCALAVDRDAVVAFEGHAFANARSGSARVWCLDAADGRVRWSVLLDGHEGRPELEGLFPVGAPVVVGDTVVVAARKPTTRLEQVDWLVALDRADGRVRWATSIAGAAGLRGLLGRRHAGLATDGDAVIVATPLGAVARVRVDDGGIAWLRRTAASLREPRFLAEPWEVASPAIAGDRVIVVAPDEFSVVALDRRTGALLESRPIGPGTDWGSPRYLHPVAGAGPEGAPLLLAVGGDVVAFDPMRLDTPLWSLAAAVEALDPPRAGADNRLGIRGRVSSAGATLLVPGVDDLLVVDARDGGVRARIAGTGPANAVLAEDRIVAAGDRDLRVLMPPGRAEELLRARLAATPDDPAAAIGLFDLALSSDRPAVALEALEAAVAGLERAQARELVEPLRGEISARARALAAASPERGRRAFELADRIATSDALRAATAIARGEFLLACAEPLAAIEAWLDVLARPELAAEPIGSEGVLRAARVEALRRIARLESRDASVRDALERRAAERAARIDPADPAAAAAFATEYARTAAAVDLVDGLAPAERSLLLPAVLRDCLVPPARLELVERLAPADAPPAIRARVAELLQASGIDRLDAGRPARRLPTVGSEPVRGIDIRGRLPQWTADAQRSWRPDLVLAVVDGALARLDGPALEPSWRLRLDDRNPLVLHAGETIVVWQSLAGFGESALVVDPVTGVIVASTPKASELWGAPPEAATAVIDETPPILAGGRRSGTLLPLQIAPFCDGERLVLVRRTGDVAASPVGPSRAFDPSIRRSVLGQVAAGVLHDGLLAVGGRTADDPSRAAVVVLDADTLAERCRVALRPDDDVLWVLATALGEVFVGTSAGIELWETGADGRPVRALDMRRAEVRGTSTPTLLGGALALLDSSDRVVVAPIHDGVPRTVAFPDDPASRTVRQLLLLDQGLLVHGDSRLMLLDRQGAVVGMDSTSRERNFVFAMPTTEGILEIDGLGGRQMQGATASFRLEFPYIVERLDPSRGLRLAGGAFEVLVPSGRCDRCLVVDGWMLLSSSMGTAAVELPSSPAGPAPAAPPGEG
jgi:outer membrane protein assembly factor BamB